MKKEMLAAVKANDVNQVSEILNEHPDILSAVLIRKTWLNHAAAHNSLAVMELLVEAGIPVNVNWGGCPAPICSAADEGQFEAVEWLLKHGACIEGTETREPPLVGAIHANSLELVKLLLTKGAKTDYTFGHFNYTPKSFAESFGGSHVEIVKLLSGTGKTSVLPVPDAVDPIVQHLERYYGQVEPMALHETVSDLPVTIHVCRVKEEEPCTILATSGMSAKAMTVPVGAEAYQHAELMMYLPFEWPANNQEAERPEYNWPYEWLRRLAHYPHQMGIWLGTSGTFSNEEPPEPFASNTQLSCILALANGGDAGQAQLQYGKQVQFYSLYPIYQEEKVLVDSQGVEALLERFQQQGVSAVLDVNRKNVA
ncbi:suppressor of fused domain protein [Pseudoalteromonas sp. SMS1]|uniref:suppressor of fused domain protein n=1 Tax=Pseudoalteromonas sp. SMS1 TaxID=2908894 RepID=UPI001F4426F0|nr:suppressor of fused domain protein [Pseudoalteromonas sp. SMS1]MCF2860526.1 suppressor of fused domain protein [Pseudoalteromonas sp. SMS1]